MTQPPEGTPEHDRPDTASYAYPGAPDAVGLSDDPAATGQGKPEGRRRGRALVVGGVAAALVLGAGAVVAVQQLSGGGSRPADVLPGDTFGYAQLDIDPSVGQKLAAVRFLGKIPEVKAFESVDARKRLWDLAVAESDEACVKKFDYDKDIAPWIGDRVGLGIRPGGSADEPNVVVALQVTDETAATTALGKLSDCGEPKDGFDLRTRDGYVLFTNKGQGDATLAAVDKGSLAQNTTFAGDVAALGEQGVASTWWDLEPAMKQVADRVGTAMLPVPAAPPQDVKGRVIAALRFDPGFAEIAGLARGLEGPQALQPVDGGAAQLVNLPDDTVAALHFSGLDAMVEQLWPELKKSMDALGDGGGVDEPLGALEDQLGLKLPADLKALLGSSLTLSLPEQDLAGGADLPAIGAKIVSADAQRAEEVVTVLEEASGSAGLLTKSLDGKVLYLSTTPDYADKLKAGGKLGESETFKAAVGDASDADQVVYVDLDRIEKLYLDQVDGDAKAAVEAMRALGISSTVTGKGEASFTVRVVAN